jgi:hypothetical protein
MRIIILVLLLFPYNAWAECCVSNCSEPHNGKCADGLAPDSRDCREVEECVASCQQGCEDAMLTGEFLTNCKEVCSGERSFGEGCCVGGICATPAYGICSSGFYLLPVSCSDLDVCNKWLESYDKEEKIKVLSVYSKILFAVLFVIIVSSLYVLLTFVRYKQGKINWLAWWWLRKFDK